MEAILCQLTALFQHNTQHNYKYTFLFFIFILLYFNIFISRITSPIRRFRRQLTPKKAEELQQYHIRPRLRYRFRQPNT